MINSVQGSNPPSTAEGLALMRAFMSIGDPALRKAIIELVEKVATAKSAH
jgi:hypothetical protein